MNTISSSTNTDLSQIYQYITSEVSSTDPSTLGTDTTSSSGDSVSLSGSASMLSNLQQLKTEDPTTFNTTLTNFTSKLRAAAASQVTNASVGLALSQLADKCESLATSSDLTSTGSSTTGSATGSTSSALASLFDSSSNSSSGNIFDTYSTASSDTSNLDQMLTNLFGDSSSS